MNHMVHVLLRQFLYSVEESVINMGVWNVRTDYRRNSMDEMLSQIHDGMVVYDRESKRVGVVEFVRFTDEDPSQPGAETLTGSHQYENHSFVESLMDGFTRDDDLSDTVRNRLIREGYIRIDGGFLAPDRIALFDQIATVSNSDVLLNALRDDLIML